MIQKHFVVWLACKIIDILYRHGGWGDGGEVSGGVKDSVVAMVVV